MHDYGCIVSLVLTGSICLAFVYLILTRRLITKGEFDKSEARTEEWKGVALRSLISNERNTAAAAKAAKVVEEVVTRQQPPFSGEGK